jgi:hypothetical protein
MRLIEFARGLGVCMLGVFLAGCAGTMQLPNPAGGATLGGLGPATRMASSNLVAPRLSSSTAAAAEVLTTAKVKISCTISDGAYSVKFMAHGKATGPYAGSFTARGRYATSLVNGQPKWVFKERFVIKSAHLVGTISAAGDGTYHCAFGPAVLKYSTETAKGKVKVAISQGSFYEKLFGL